ncbi:MAG: L,D-transpeptidase family protein [Alphaproteobacteria bacterium]
MNLTVRRDGARHVLDWGAGPRPCTVGHGGVGQKQREGDGVTPMGAWPLRRVFYRPDRLDAPKTVLPVIQIEEEDGWCDAPDDVNYNKLVQLPYPSHAEALWRRDHLYDVVVVIGFNDAPIIKGKGSAIFLHLARKDYAPTQGCVAANKEDLLEALAQLSRGDRIRIES